MAQYLLSVHHDGTNPYATDEDMQRAFAEVGAFNAALQESGSWVFAGGLLPASTAVVVRASDGTITRTEGPHLPGPEHLGGMWVIDVADDDTALAWAERATVACQGAVEVRPFQSMPDA